MVTNSAQATVRTIADKQIHTNEIFSILKKSNRDASMAAAAHIYNPSAPESEIGLQ